jgi:DNA-binding CsgD family transcriptional regulator
LKHAASVRLTKTYEEIRRLLEEGVAPSSSGHAQLQAADRRLLKHNSRQLRPEEVDELVAAYQRGLSAKAVAAKFGIHRGTVAAHLERRSITQRSPYLLTADRVAEARRLRDEGLSYRSIGEQLAVSSMTVWRAIAAENDHPRS